MNSSKKNSKLITRHTHKLHEVVAIFEKSPAVLFSIETMWLLSELERDDYTIIVTRWCHPIGVSLSILTGSRFLSNHKQLIVFAFYTLRKLLMVYSEISGPRVMSHICTSDLLFTIWWPQFRVLNRKDPFTMSWQWSCVHWNNFRGRTGLGNR